MSQSALHAPLLGRPSVHLQTAVQAGPVPAYDLKLIKRIEVDGTFDQPDFRKPYMEVQSAKVTKIKTTCRLAIDVDSRDVTSAQEV